jgi:hypothetical protein
MKQWMPRLASAAAVSMLKVASLSNPETPSSGATQRHCKGEPDGGHPSDECVGGVKEIVSVSEKPRDTIKASETMGVAAVSMLKGR